MEVSSFDGRLPFSFGSDFTAGIAPMSSIFAGCVDQLQQFVEAQKRLAGDPAMNDYMPKVRAEKLALGLVGIARGIYKLTATWRTLIAQTKAETKADAQKLTNGKNPLSDADVQLIRHHYHSLSVDARRAWLREQTDCLANGDMAAKGSLIAVLSAPKSVGLVPKEVRASVERKVAGEAYDELMIRWTAIQCASEAVDRLVSYVRSQTNTQSDPAAAIASDTQAGSPESLSSFLS
jgi:hypothetical protein